LLVITNGITVKCNRNLSPVNVSSYVFKGCSSHGVDIHCVLLMILTDIL